MSSHSEYNGKPVCASREVPTDLLRDDLGFDGIVVSDYAFVERLPNVFGTAERMAEVGELCLKAGMDMKLPERVGYAPELLRDAEIGRFDMAYPLDLYAEGTDPSGHARSSPG